jgi:hypothetical protein
VSKPGLDELGGAAAQHGLLAEEVGLGLVLEARLDDAAARAADALGVGEREVAGLAGRVLVDGDEARDARALGVLAAHEVAGALRGGERDVDAGGRRDLVVVDAEAVAEEQQVALGDPVADLGLPDLAVQLVGDEEHHDVALAGRVGDAEDLVAVVAGLLHGLRVLAQADDDVDARVLEVQGVGVALRAVADDGHGLAVQEAEIRVVVVEHGARPYRASRDCWSAVRSRTSQSQWSPVRWRTRTAIERSCSASSSSIASVK